MQNVLFHFCNFVAVEPLKLDGLCFFSTVGYLINKGLMCIFRTTVNYVNGCNKDNELKLSEELWSFGLMVLFHQVENVKTHSL